MEWFFLAWTRYADFYGRSSRREFWMFQLMQIVAAILVAGAASFFVYVVKREGAVTSDDGVYALFIAICSLYGLATIVPTTAITVRRLHDTGRSAWWLLLLLAGLIPIIIIFMCLDGNPGPNKYGPDPKFPEEDFEDSADGPGFASVGPDGQPQPLTGRASFGYCKHCGVRLKDKSPYCSQCGTHT